MARNSIIKNICNHIYIHPLYYLFAFLSCLTGHFKAFSFLTILILIHESGHIILGILAGWKIKRIIILPFGGMTEFDDLLNRPIYQELMILIAGPFFQIVFSYFYPNPYHVPLLLFNLLPIYPLDGSKAVFLFWNVVGAYYRSYQVVFLVSYVAIFTGLYFMRNLLFVIFGVFFMWRSLAFIRDLPLIFQLFLFERYRYSLVFKRKKKIKKYKKMKRDYEHIILIGGKYISEKEFLLNLFQNKV